MGRVVSSGARDQSSFEIFSDCKKSVRRALNEQIHCILSRIPSQLPGILTLHFPRSPATISDDCQWSTKECVTVWNEDYAWRRHHGMNNRSPLVPTVQHCRCSMGATRQPLCVLIQLNGLEARPGLTCLWMLGDRSVFGRSKKPPVTARHRCSRTAFVRCHYARAV